jgi:hypothetical protein
VRAAYFEVQGGSEWARITNLKITTYGTSHIEVYFKYGDAANYEQTPCAWTKVAETSPSWYGGYWKKVYPPWENGFTPVVLPANEKASFYIVNMGTSYGLLAKYYSNPNRYHSPWVELPPSSPVGSATMSIGKRGYENSPFKVYSPSSQGYGLYGGVKLETLQPGSTESPTAAPTEPYTSGTIESVNSGTPESFNGVQFSIRNLGSEDIIINNLSVLFDSSGTKQLEIWFREGHHTISQNGCDNWNNWCNDWAKVASGTAYSAGPTVHTQLGQNFIAITKAGAYSSFAVVSGTGGIITRTATEADTVENGVIKVEAGAAIEDYYGDQVQTIHSLKPDVYMYQGVIDYDIAHSLCAVQSKAPWVVMDPLGASSMGEGQDLNEPEVQELVYFDPNLNDGPIDGGVGPIDGESGPDEEALQ